MDATDAEAVRRRADAELPLPVGTRIRFTTEYGSNPGTHDGRIIRRMVPTPGNFADGMTGGMLATHYEVEIFLPAHGQSETVIVPPSAVEQVLDD